MPHTGLRYRTLWLAAVLVATGTPLFGQTLSTWTTPDSGAWTDPAHWSTSPSYPNNGTPAGTTYDARILAIGSPYTVTLSSNVSLQALTLNSPDATLLQTGGILSAGSLSLTAGTFNATGGGMQTSAVTGPAGINVTGNYMVNASSLATNTNISPGAILTVAGLTNTGTITVSSGATLNLASTNTTAGLGTVHSNGGSVLINGVLNNVGSTLALSASTGPWTLVGSRIHAITNGTVTGTTPNNLIALGGTLTSVTLDGDLSVGDGATPGVTVVTSLLSLTPNSRILFNVPAGTSATSLLTSGVNSTFAAGELVFNGSGDGGVVRPETSGTSLTFSPAFTARTGTRGGTLGASDSPLVNNGTLSAQTAGRTLSVLGTTFTNTGTLQASSGGTLSITGAFSNSGTAAVAGASVMKVTGTIANTGKVDLAGGALVLDYTGASPVSWLRSQLSTGRSGGSWTSPTGITSSTAAADPRLAVAYAEASDLGVTTWAGVSVDSTTLLTKLTYYGDANLDGTVNSDDFALVDRGYALHLTSWTGGDFDYSGTVDAADYLLLDRVFIQQGNPLSPSLLAQRESQFGSAYAAQLLAVVPEPSTTLLLATGLPLLMRRRRA